MVMSSFKKFGLLAMVAVMVLMLAACGGGSSSKDSSSSDGKKTLTVSVDEGYAKYVDKIKSKFEKDNDVTVKVVKKDMFETLEALPLDGPAGTAPDVMMSAYDRIGSLGQQGHLAEVRLGNKDQLDDNDVKQVTIDDKVYGAPAIIETLVLYYNKDLLDKAPTTFKELEALTKDPRFNFATEKGKSTAFLAKWTDFYFSYGLLAGYGGYVFGDNGTNPKDIGLNNAGSVEGITYATKWFQTYWPKGMQDNKSADDFIQDQFVKGKAGAIIGGPWSAASYKEAKLNYGVAEIPTLDNGKPYSPFAGGKGWVISNYSKNKDVAQKWLDYVTNTDNQNTLYDMTNEVPANHESRDVAAAKKDELTSAVIAQYANATPMPNIPEMAEVWTGAENLMFDAASGNKTPKQSANDAVKVISDNIDQKYQK